MRGLPIDMVPQPGTQKAPQNTDITKPCYVDTDHVHFPDDGRLRTLPPYAVALIDADYVQQLGACRSIWAQKMAGTYKGDVSLFGTNTHLLAIKNGTLYNITPMLGQKSESLGSAPLAVHSGDATMTITWASHGLGVGDIVTIQGATDVDAVSASTHINIAHRVDSVLGANSFTVELGTTAASTTTGGGDNITITAEMVHAILGSNPLSVTSGSAIVTVSYTAHGLSVGDRVRLFNASDVGGITASTYINIEHIVATTPNANSFTIVVGTNASSTATGGGSAVSFNKQIAAGNLDQGAAVGYGSGVYGEGVYGVGGESTSAQAFPRIWSFDDFGSEIVMCPGDYYAGDGQKIYLWDGNVAIAPQILPNAPTDANWVFVANNSIVALRGLNLSISEIGDGTVWDGITTYSATVRGVWKLISGVERNDKTAIIAAPGRTYILRYVGGGDLWDFSVLVDEGFIAPCAYAVVNDVLCWRSSRGFYAFDGGQPVKVENAQNYDWIIKNTNMAQAWKCHAVADSDYGQVYHYFPTGDELEAGDYVIHNLRGNHWTLGRMQRTAGQRPAMLDSSFIMTDAGTDSTVFDIYRHFTTGAVTFNWYAETAMAYFGDGSKVYCSFGVVPDSNMDGSVIFTPYGRLYPQSPKIEYTSVTINSDTKQATIKQSGRLLGYKISGSSAATIGMWKTLIKPLGGR